jgi:hypothetical protein
MSWTQFQQTKLENRWILAKFYQTLLAGCTTKLLIQSKEDCKHTSLIYYSETKARPCSNSNTQWNTNVQNILNKGRKINTQKLLFHYIISQIRIQNKQQTWSLNPAFRDITTPQRLPAVAIEVTWKPSLHFLFIHLKGKDSLTLYDCCVYCVPVETRTNHNEVFFSLVPSIVLKQRKKPSCKWTNNIQIDLLKNWKSHGH